MSKQTAVEWLVEQIEKNHNFRFGNFYWAEIQQAKAMERQQFEESYFKGLGSNFQTFEQYYERTFGKEASHEG